MCLSHSAFDRKYGLDLIKFAAVDGGLAAFVVERIKILEKTNEGGN